MGDGCKSHFVAAVKEALSDATVCSERDNAKGSLEVVISKDLRRVKLMNELGLRSEDISAYLEHDLVHSKEDIFILAHGTKQYGDRCNKPRVTADYVNEMMPIANGYELKLDAENIRFLFSCVHPTEGNKEEKPGCQVKPVLFRALLKGNVKSVEDQIRVARYIYHPSFQESRQKQAAECIDLLIDAKVNLLEEGYIFRLRDCLSENVNSEVYRSILKLRINSLQDIYNLLFNNTQINTLAIASTLYELKENADLIIRLNRHSTTDYLMCKKDIKDVKAEQVFDLLDVGFDPRVINAGLLVNLTDNKDYSVLSGSPNPVETVMAFVNTFEVGVTPENLYFAVQLGAEAINTYGKLPRFRGEGGLGNVCQYQVQYYLQDIDRVMSVQNYAEKVVNFLSSGASTNPEGVAKSTLKSVK